MPDQGPMPPMTSFSVTNQYIKNRRFRALLWASTSLVMAYFFDATVMLSVTVIVSIYFSCQWFLLGRVGSGVVELDEHGLCLPAVFTGFRSSVLPFESIRVFGRQQHKKRERLLITTGLRGYTIGIDALGETQFVQLYEGFLKQRSVNEEGKRWLARRELDRLHLKAFRHLPSHVTRVLMVLIVLGYAAELKWAALEVFSIVGGDPIRLLSLGAYSSALTGPEHLYRLVSTMFLHAGLLHLYVNGIAFWALGGLIERLLGASRFLIVYMSAGVAGSYVSGLLRDAAPAVGASGAIFGLLGSFLVLHFFEGSPLPRVLRQTARWWMVILGLNMGLPLLVPQIDATAHFVGMIAGGLVTSMFFLGRARLRVPGFWLKLFGILVGAATLAMLAVAVRQITVVDPRVISNRLLEQSEQVPSALINQIAWTRVEQRQVAVADLRSALRAAQQRLAVDEADFHLRDTLASLHFRLNELTLAKREELLAFEQAQALHVDGSGALLGAPADSRRIFATQFYRFAHTQALQDWTLLDFEKTGDVQFKSVAQYSGTKGFFAVRQNAEVLGVLWLQLPPLDESGEEGAQPLVANIMDYRPPPSQMAPLYQEPYTGGDAQFGYFPLASEVMALPGPDKSEIPH
jgi:membrane associated rhomboid family serine protease